MQGPKYNYNIDYFIKKFLEVPEENWCIREFVNVKGQFCALGHCGQTPTSATYEADSLQDLFIGNVADINDGKREYKRLGNTPKARIIQALMLLNKGEVL